ncbi:carbon-nitrogen hydrolase family protein [Methanosphaera sp. WGK6]|uniref:carbon-nitrogen hydrolase family protein n=1 Tax=Methanosphaera sp. WGK6 TaxID=1561964 RepID=UPI001F516F33|nr:carbon-nitrogen hydrolase family protein [Methanosphaera sp. WGK6]
MKDFKIASCQMNVVDNKKVNIEHACNFIKKATSHNVKMVTLPEMFNTPYTNDKFIEYAEFEENSITLNAMQDIAKEENIYLQCGSIPEKEETNIYNTAYLINPKGKIIGKHRKMHMFDIDTNTIKFTESDTLTPGNSVTTIKTDLGKISLAICYDIRFPELWTLMSKNQTDIILLPGAFNKTTGPLHWETLIRARAIDTQSYVLATSPSQIENPYYVAWGHSMIVDPWGKIVAKATEKEAILYANLKSEHITSVRSQIPILKNKRNDIYDTVQKE